MVPGLLDLGQVPVRPFQEYVDRAVRDFYVTAWTPEKIEEFMAGIDLVSEELGLPSPLPPASLIGVESLFEPDVLVELETTAIAAPVSTRGAARSPAAPAWSDDPRRDRGGRREGSMGGVA